MESENTLANPTEQPDNPLSRAIRADENGIITEPKCHLCKSKFRLQMEEMFDLNNPIAMIRKFLEDNGEKYPKWRIQHHFDRHYKPMQMQAAIAEWRDNLSVVLQRRRNMVDDVCASIEISWIKLADILVIDTGNDIDKELKKMRMLADLQKTILEGHMFIKSLHDSEAKARALEERFEKVWKMKLDEAKDDAERKMLISTLRDFQDKIRQFGQ